MQERESTVARYRNKRVRKTLVTTEYFAEIQV